MLQYLISSLLTLGIWFMLYFLLGSMLCDFLKLPVSIALAFPPLLFLIQYLFFPPFIDRLLSPVEWKSQEPSYQEMAELLSELSQKQKIPVPRLGIRQSGFPELYTYGHHRGNCRIVMSTALLELLSTEERRSIAIHELQHVARNDFIILMGTGLIPILLFLLSRNVLIFGTGLKDFRNIRSLASAGLFFWWMTGLFYMFLYLVSRVREGRADRGAAMQSPEHYGPALEKIAAAQAAKSSGDLRRDYALGLNFLSILDPWIAGNAALDSSYGKAGQGGGAHNPWLAWYKLFSSHPPIAERLERMSGGKSPRRSAEKMLFLEMAAFFLPLMACGAGVIMILLGATFVGLPVVLFGLSLYITITLRYPRIKSGSGGDRQGVSHLSPMAGVPVRTGGALSKHKKLELYPQFVLLIRSDGEIPVQLRSYVPAEALLDDRYYGHETEITGWIRSDPFSYIEVKEIRHGEDRKRKKIFSSTSIVLQYLLAYGSIFCGLLLIALQLGE